MAANGAAAGNTCENGDMRMDENERVVAELNRFLQGRYMGIRQYQHLIDHARDGEIKELLRTFQAHAARGAEMVAERIRRLGGKPADELSIMGKLRDWMAQWKHYPEETEDVLRDALAGENKYGIRFSHAMVAGDLDEESARLIDRILEEDQRRVDRIRAVLQERGKDRAGSREESEESRAGSR
jgi:bacterioferritin